MHRWNLSSQKPLGETTQKPREIPLHLWNPSRKKKHWGKTSRNQARRKWEKTETTRPQQKMIEKGETNWDAIWHRSDLKNSANFRHKICNFFANFQGKASNLIMFVANFAETQPNFVGISQITQKTLQNAENQKKTEKN